jgi:GIY-YIG catalytic domain/NUMOD1 domain
MLEKNFNLNSLKFLYITKSYISSNIEINNDIDLKNKKTPHNYTKIIINNPYYNRNIIANISKNRVGVYIWESVISNDIYVGHSINLYNRISSYFMPSILKSANRKVLKYFNEYGFENVKLIILLMKEGSSIEEVIELEQYFIDQLDSNLNIDRIARGTGFHAPMSLKAREILRRLRGDPIFLYNINNDNKVPVLLYIFDSKQHMYNSIKIDHRTLKDCLDLGKIYLDYFFFSLEPITESYKEELLKLEELKKLVFEKKSIYLVKQPLSKCILAENIYKPNLNSEYNSISELAKYLKGDRGTIREYINGTKKGFYRKQWKLTWIENKILSKLN